MRSLILLLLSTLAALAQGGGYCTMSTWEPRNIATKAGLVASYDPGNTNTLVFNGPVQVSAMSNRVTAGTADLLQGTAANQPIISRSDNNGNIVLQSETFNTTWGLNQINAFGATDTGATGDGSFANTSRTLDPTGGYSASFIQENNVSSVSHWISQLIPYTNSKYILKVSLKPAGRSWCSLVIWDLVNVYRVFFQLSGSGVIGTQFPNTVGRITTQLNGWYLCEIETSILTATTGGYAQICLAEADNVGAYNGDNTSGLYIWGASLRQSTWDTNYIATTTTPVYPGLGNRSTLYFGGANHFMKTAAFTLNQPEEVYCLGNQITWTLNDIVLDGNSSTERMVIQQNATSPKLNLYAGNYSGENAGLTVGGWGLVKAVFNSASSSIIVNGGAPVVGNANTHNGNGVTIGARYDGGLNFANIRVARVLICNKTNAPAESSYLSWGMMKQASLY
jgi:hypothetical protein